MKSPSKRGLILNPRTGRYVLRTGRIGKGILKNKRSSTKRKKSVKGKGINNYHKTNGGSKEKKIPLYSRLRKFIFREPIEEVKSTPTTKLRKTAFGIKGIQQHIMEYADADCDGITEEGKRCRNAFKYSKPDKFGNVTIKNCSDYCLNHCDKWLEQFFSSQPEIVILENINTGRIREVKLDFLTELHLMWIDEKEKTNLMAIDENSTYEYINEVCSAMKTKNIIYLRVEIRIDTIYLLTSNYKFKSFKNMPLYLRNNKFWTYNIPKVGDYPLLTLNLI